MPKSRNLAAALLSLALFALFIGGIQSLGWWTRTASAQAPVTQLQSAEGCQPCDALHWRSLVMHQ